eukprot:1160415-Pelagomonas_calceolata.AAC.2
MAKQVSSAVQGLLVLCPNKGPGQAHVSHSLPCSSCAEVHCTGPIASTKEGREPGCRHCVQDRLVAYRSQFQEEKEAGKQIAGTVQKKPGNQIAGTVSRAHCSHERADCRHRRKKGGRKTRSNDQGVDKHAAKSVARGSCQPNMQLQCMHVCMAETSESAIWTANKGGKGLLRKRKKRKKKSDMLPLHTSSQEKEKHQLKEPKRKHVATEP